MESSTNIVDIDIMMPTLNAGDIARSIVSKTNSVDIKAQLLFLPGQYLFVTNEGDSTTYKFLSPSALREAFSGEPIDSGFLFANTIRWGVNAQGEYIVQFYPPQRYSVTLTNTDNSNLIVITIPMPGLVFIGCGNSYWLWAIKEARVAADSQLFHAPLPNVSSTGSICFGTIATAKCSASGIGQAWDLFWRSPFNSDSVQNKSQNAPSDVRSQLLKLHNKNSRKYPLSDLVPSRYNIEDAIKQIKNI